MNRKYFVVAVFIVLTMVLTACGTSAAPVEVAGETITIVETVIVEVAGEVVQVEAEPVEGILSRVLECSIR